MFGFLKKKREPANALEAFIFAVYGNPPPPKRANPEEATQLAYDELLKKEVEREDVGRVVAGLHEGPVPYSTQDLALSAALNIFKQPESVPRLFNTQLYARLKAAEWFKQGKVNPILVRSFEDTLYKLYKPVQS